jgi:hypothetical protein
VTAPARKPDLFSGVLAALQTAYAEEVRRLADEYRPRILAGEFSGFEGIDRIGGVDRIGPDQGAPRHIRLENDLEKRHPWIRTTHGARAVLACSSWPDRPGCSRDDAPGTDRQIAAESMAHDVLAVAVERGWVKPYRMYGGAYALRVG